MADYAYTIMMYILIIQVLAFLILALPTPPKIKGRVVRAIINSKIMSKLLWVHLGLCIIAGIFFADLNTTENKYVIEKNRFKETAGITGSELRVSFLSYQIQILQRNKYITVMLIYATIVLNVYLRLLYHVYDKRGDYGEVEGKVEAKAKST